MAIMAVELFEHFVLDNKRNCNPNNIFCRNFLPYSILLLIAYFAELYISFLHYAWILNVSDFSLLQSPNNGYRLLLLCILSGAK